MPRKNRPKPLAPKPLPRTNCGSKRAFATEKLAQRAADDGMLMTPGLELRVYRCSFCGRWHLTSLGDGR